MKKSIIFLVLFTLACNKIFAQCAMCKSVVESNIDGGSAIGAGLNDGILYLMAMPYISLVLIAFLWSRHSRKTQA
jgi:hypothetical protein